MSKSERLYTISELAAMFDVSPRTIRYYEEVGLMTSETRDVPTRQRRYTDSERRRLKLILRGKRLGFSLHEIKEMVDMYESNPTGEEERRKILEYTDRKLIEIQEKIDQLEMMKSDIWAHREKFIHEKKR